MAQHSIFDPATLPEAHAHQIRSFIRIHWHDEYLYDLDAALFPSERHPRHVVVHDRHALLSHARVIWVDFAHAGETWRLYCLGDVLTYPAFRRRGHGGEAVAAATRLIRKDAAADAAILFTDPATTAFYAAHGWEPVLSLTATFGHPVASEPSQGTAMMLFLSDRAKGRRAVFETQTLALPGWGW
jgi:predicted GNAT family N-acyltransferase